MTFKIESTLAKNYKNRTLKENLKIVIPIFIVGAILNSFRWDRTEQMDFILITIGLIVLLSIQFIAALGNLDNVIKKYAINLTEIGLDEFEGSKLKRHISWNNMKFELMKNGAIKVSEARRQVKSMSLQKRIVIFIPPEIERKNELINEIQIHCT